MSQPSDRALRAKLEELGPTVEGHPLDCKCDHCTMFSDIMDELAKRDRQKRSEFSVLDSRRRQVRSFRS